jgi:glycine betaine/proline transport system substrate-binding protein
MATALVLAACAEEDGDGPTGDGGGPLAGQEITIGVFEGWDEGMVASYLMGHVFEDAGATVNYEFGDVVVVYQGVAEGTYDVAFDAWLPNTHADYWDELGDRLENLGTWFDDAVLSIAVNEDSPAQSIADLTDHVDTYGGRIVGIEAGSGLNRLTRESVIPTYGLEDAGYEFLESSTAAMLTELETAIDAGENIVVTLWHPHWAYAAFPIRDLADPEDALAGGDEHIDSFGRPGFTEEFPEAAEWIGNFHLTQEQVTELEDIMVVQDNREDPAGSVQQWLDANPEWIDQLKAGELR